MAASVDPVMKAAQAWTLKSPLKSCFLTDETAVLGVISEQERSAGALLEQRWQNSSKYYLDSLTS